MWISVNISNPPEKGHYKCLIDYDGLGTLSETEFEFYDGSDWSHFQSNRQFIRYWEATKEQYDIIVKNYMKDFETDLLSIRNFAKGNFQIGYDPASPEGDFQKEALLKVCEGKVLVIGVGDDMKHVSLPYGFIDHNMDMIFEITPPQRSVVLSNVRTNAQMGAALLSAGIVKAGKSHQIQDIIKDEFAKAMKSTQKLIGDFEEPKSKYINNPQRNYRKR